MTVTSGFYTVFGKTATYTPVGGVAVPDIKVVLDEEYDLKRELDKSTMSHEGQIRVSQSQVAARPTKGATFVVTDGAGNSQTWTVMRCHEDAGIMGFAGEWVCDCKRDVRPKVKGA